MVLSLNEYIKQSYKRPNKKVLEGLGASQELIEYLMKTPGNTNLKIVEAINESGGDTLTPHTFHFELTETTSLGTVLVCEETDTWLNYLNTSIDGKILKGTISNITQDGSPVSIEFNEQYYGQLAYKNVPGLGEYSGMIAFTLEDISGVTGGVQIMYIPTYHILGASEIMCDSFDITLELQEGYKITSDMSADPEMELLIDYMSIKVKMGGSWTVNVRKVTDGTNIYQFGDVITPTSDMTLTLIVE